MSGGLWCLLIVQSEGDACLAPLAEHAMLDLKVIHSSSMLSVKFTYK